MNQPMRKSWTDEMIASEILSISNGSGQMPTCSYLKSLGRNDLMCQITRRGGVLAWAKRLGLSRDQSDSDVGWDGEKIAIDLLKLNGFEAEKTNGVKYPFDIVVDNIIRVDVKTAKYAEYGPSKGWFYRIGKTPQADVIALLQIDTNDIFFVPWYSCPTTNITVNRKDGKYEPYRNNYESLRKLSKILSDSRTIWPNFNL